MRYDVVVRSRVRGAPHVAEHVWARRIKPGSVQNVLHEAAEDSYRHLSRNDRIVVRGLSLRHDDGRGNVVGSVWMWSARKALVVAAVPRKGVA